MYTVYQTPDGYRTPSQMGSREASILGYHLKRLIVEWGDSPLGKITRRHMWRIARKYAHRGAYYCNHCGQTLAYEPCGGLPGHRSECAI